MTDTTLTREQILTAAEDVLRRFGPTKATVIDVARALGVSHGSVYRHFASKAALRDAVTAQWLARVTTPLLGIVHDRGPAIPRLRRWFDLLMKAKRARALEEPELFATYIQLASESRNVVNLHVEVMVQQLSQIVADGIISGEIDSVDPPLTARALFDATARFHHPAHAPDWSSDTIDAAFDGVWALLVRGLGRPPKAGATTRRGLPPDKPGGDSKARAAVR
jgi:AcrR family transcriptional regulator